LSTGGERRHRDQSNHIFHSSDDLRNKKHLVDVTGVVLNKKNKIALGGSSEVTAKMFLY